MGNTGQILVIHAAVMGLDCIPWHAGPIVRRLTQISRHRMKVFWQEIDTKHE
jgi:hypothetical protein